MTQAAKNIYPENIGAIISLLQIILLYVHHG